MRGTPAKKRGNMKAFKSGHDHQSRLSPIIVLSELRRIPAGSCNEIEPRAKDAEIAKE